MTTECWFVVRTVQALELLATGPRTVAEVAEAVNIHERTARRMLNRLVGEGYLDRTDGFPRRYRHTPRMVEIATRIVEHADTGGQRTSSAYGAAAAPLPRTLSRNDSTASSRRLGSPPQVRSAAA